MFNSAAGDPENVVTTHARCLKNAGYAASLEQGTEYRVVPDPEAESSGMLRVVDESGEDYLYPARFFALRLATEPSALPSPKSEE